MFAKVFSGIARDPGHHSVLVRAYHQPEGYGAVYRFAALHFDLFRLSGNLLLGLKTQGLHPT